MSQLNFDQNNPYQAPPSAAPLAPISAAANLQQLKMLKDFRSQIVALGAFWIIIGGLAVGLGAFATSLLAGQNAAPQTLAVMCGILVVMGLAWVTLGVLACLKQMWAVYVGLVLSYLSVIGNLVNLNVCGLVILVVVIIQAHRVIGWAGQLTRAGIPLNTRPEQLSMPLQLPPM
jgi:hypothetical protein